MTKLSVNIADLKIINELVEKHDIKQGFDLIYNNHSGIGYTLEMQWETEIHGTPLKVTASLVDETDW
jgi:hypothetical protein